MQNHKIVVIKIGTDAIGNFHDSEAVENLVKSAVWMIQNGWNPLIVTSGAVGFGKQSHGQLQNKQALAAMGQPLLMNAYIQAFGKYGIHVAQVLQTHADIERYKENQRNFMRTVQSLREHGIVPIVNENDSVSTEEMRRLKKGTDNDKNALLITQLIRAKALILITEANGLMEDFPHEDSRIASMQYELLHKKYIKKIVKGGTKGGTGGMKGKLKIARKSAERGTITYITDGKSGRTAQDFLQGRDTFPKNNTIGGTIVY